jgi:gamma-glutamylcyclotransferase (GGCT)/AIG2-like uncharacterized protein YtfP
VSEGAAESVFVYGTLTVPRVMRAVTGREFDLLPASLPGYACFRVRGAAYPGVVESEGGVTPGFVCVGVDTALLARLDRFEGRVYERRRVTVRVEPDERREAWAWVIRPEHRSLLSNEPWNRERFVRHDLPSFLRDEG